MLVSLLVAPDPSLDDVLAALGITAQPSDYVVVVDTSESMLADGRYDSVGTAVQGMVSNLGPEDAVAIVTFSGSAAVVYRGSDPAAALAALPPANGAFTDIGAGIAAGLAELESGDSSRPAVIALITDGTIDTAAGSSYPAGSPAWVDLRTRADTLTSRREVAAYSIGLGDVTGADLMSVVFPNATTVPDDEIGTHLASLDRQLLAFQAAQRIRPDLTGVITASLVLPDQAKSESAITLASDLTVVPVEISELAVSAGDSTAPLAAGPVRLAPGEAVTLSVTLDDVITNSDGALQLQGRVTSPWQAVMTDLGLDFAPVWLAQPIDHAAPPPTQPYPRPQALGISIWPVLGAVAGAMLALLLVTFAWSRRSRLTGSVLVSTAGVPVHEFVLSGHRTPLSAVAAPAIPDLVGKVTSRREHVNGLPTIRLSARLGADRAKATLRDGESVNLGKYQITYTAQRTRTLEMVRTGIAGSPERWQDPES